MDSLIAGVIFIAVAVYLYKRNVPHLLVWVLITYMVTYNMFKLSRTLAIVAGVAAAYAVCYYSTYEHFEQEDLKKKEEPEATGKSTPHVDLGTTILHAYRNLSPEQIGGMKRDTKELMELQKELMGTLAEMKPAIEQGAELLGTFSQFFGSGAMSQ
jgi:Ca2+/Na+ antiporter